MTNLFLKAAKRKFRFSTAKGSLNLEQLFQLSEQELHELYLSLETSIQSSKGLLGRKGNTEVEEKMEIVKAVFDSVREDKNAAQNRLDNKALKEKILTAIEEKETDELKGKSVKELRKMANKL